MNPKQLWSRRRPHLWFQLYWVVYLIWFFWLDLTIKDPKYIIPVSYTHLDVYKRQLTLLLYNEMPSSFNPCRDVCGKSGGT